MSGTTSPRSSTSTLRDANMNIQARLVEEGLNREELRAEEYGGDDPKDPAPKEDGAAPLPPKESDPYKVTWDGPDDAENPQNWSVSRKWAITVLCSLMTVNVTFASSAPSATGEYVAADFGVSEEVGYLITSIFLCGYVCGPLLWGPGSEMFGRKAVFYVSLVSYVLMHLGQALAHNIGTLLVTRFLTGVFACAPLTVCGGILVDIWDPINRGRATALFSACIFVGPVLGPIVGGYVAMSYLGWRWVFWIMMIFAGACTVLALVLLPETYAPVILQRKARRLRKAEPELNAKLYAEHERADWSLSGILHRTLFRPIIMLMKEPILVLVTIYLSLVYGVLYALFEALPLIFIGTRGFNLGEAGLIFIGVGTGSSLGAYMTIPLSRHYPKLTAKWRGFPPPEERLWGAMIGGPSLVIGCFWLGWTGQYPSIHWIVPALATIPIGASVALIFNSFLSYLVDTYLQYSASAFSANTMIRSAVGAAFPLFTVSMFNRLGINWACSLVGFCCLILAPSPFLFYRYGTWVRAKSKFSPCLDLVIAKEIAAEEAEAAAKGSEKV